MAHENGITCDCLLCPECYPQEPIISVAEDDPCDMQGYRDAVCCGDPTTVSISISDGEREYVWDECSQAFIERVK